MTKPDDLANDNIRGWRVYEMLLNRALLAHLGHVNNSDEVAAAIELLSHPDIASMLPEPYDLKRLEAIEELKSRRWPGTLVNRAAREERAKTRGALREKQGN